LNKLLKLDLATDDLLGLVVVDEEDLLLLLFPDIVSSTAGTPVNHMDKLRKRWWPAGNT
jgi:hypothetical protein